MTDDYTPTAEEVRAAYRAWSDGQDDSHPNKPAWSAEEFDRWLAAHDAEKRTEWEAEQGEAEWEYGLMSDDAHVDSWGVVRDEARELPAMRAIADGTGERVVRRRRPGGWAPVAENGGER